jgi:hypothetical protein
VNLRSRRQILLLLGFLSVAAVHIAIVFLFYGYGARVLRDMHLSSNLILGLWLGVPSILAFTFYYRFLSRSAFLISQSMSPTVLALNATAIGVFAVIATLFSLFWGVFFSLNTFGE